MTPLALVLAAGPWAWAAPAGGTAAQADPPRRRLAGLVVRSDDYELRRGPETVEEFRGHAFYRHQGRALYADLIERRHKGDRWRARGRVRAVLRQDDGTVLEARGQEAGHDGEAQTGWLRAAPGHLVEFERRPPQAGASLDQARARELTWHSGRVEARLSGEVHAWGPSGEAWADEALYRHAARRLELLGRRPVLASGSPRFAGALQADRITATRTPEETIEAQGRVRGWAVFREHPAAIGP